jgi:putative radical SAM enzyme (TIGR03279 family)
MTRSGTKIRKVEFGSSAHRIGLIPGDQILAINGHPVPDELALRFHLADELINLQVRRVDGSEVSHELDLTEGTDLGVELEDFRTRTCNNACLFCFIDQLPPGVRDTLKVKDDDYRLSFLHGNYITLTNLADRELDRIIEQRLSPLYVSVHATDPDLRTRILGRRKVDDLERKLTRLIQGGILLHTQIVLMPGINDGKHLEKTVFDLYDRYPGVDSTAIVPLGLSAHGAPREVFVPVTASYCRDTIAQVSSWQERFRREIHRTFSYLADEFYIQGGIPLPNADHYDDFAQIEDGVGMVRKFVDEFEAELARRRKRLPGLRGTLATGKLFCPFLRQCTGSFNAKLGSQLEICEVESRFMGPSITVAGLLAGRDLLSALQGRNPGDFVIIPDEAVSRVDGVLVDDLSSADLEGRLGKPVYPSGRTMHDFFELLLKLAPGSGKAHS